MGLRLDAVTAAPLNVPLVDPFVIASGRIDVTRAVLVRVALVDTATGARAEGLGEAAPLPPVTREDEPDVLDAVRAWAARAVGRVVEGRPVEAWRAVLDDALAARPVACAGVETAFVDAACRLHGCSLAEALRPVGDGAPFAWEVDSDITIPILETGRMAALATTWRAMGFTRFKVKVGLDLAHDLAALVAIRGAVDDAVFRLDANGGFSARDALALCARCRAEGLAVECFEQPCARDDLDGMRAVTEGIEAPVIADESVRDLDDLRRVVDARAARGVNLKLVKHGGPSRAYDLGAAALAQGLSLMCGAMVETRLGISAAAQLCVALGDVRFVDLDTAWLLRDDPFAGGYEAAGPRYRVSEGPGHGVTTRG